MAMLNYQRVKPLLKPTELVRQAMSRLKNVDFTQRNSDISPIKKHADFTIANLVIFYHQRGTKKLLRAWIHIVQICIYRN